LSKRAHEAAGLPSEGQQPIQLWIDRHRRLRELLLEQHLGRKILQQLPAALLKGDLQDREAIGGRSGAG
jgi:hypothetical protein